MKKSFRDRNPYVIGIASVMGIAAMVGLAMMVGVLHLFEKEYKVKAVFSDSSGVRGGDDVRVAGVRSGRVKKVKANREQGTIEVDMTVKANVHLGPRTRAEIKLQTLLGTKYVALSGPSIRPYMEDQPTEKRVIPVERTRTPFEIFELTNIGTRSIQRTDTKKLNEFVTQLADITQGNAKDIQTLVHGLDDVSTGLAEREEQLRQLIDRFQQLSKTLADKDETLVGLIDYSQAVLDVVIRHRDEIARGLRGGEKMASHLAGIVTVNKAQIDAILETVHPLLRIVDKRARNVDQFLAWFGPGNRQTLKSMSHGPWVDVYVRAIGPDFVQMLKEATGQQ